MKKLDTVVDDVYNVLSCLCDQETLDIPDDYIEDFGERMKEALKGWATPKKDAGGLRMSTVGRPLRRLWYDLKHEVPVYNRRTPLSSLSFCTVIYLRS